MDYTKKNNISNSNLLHSCYMTLCSKKKNAILCENILRSNKIVILKIAIQFHTQCSFAYTNNTMIVHYSDHSLDSSLLLLTLSHWWRAKQRHLMFEKANKWWTTPENRKSACPSHTSALFQHPLGSRASGQKQCNK